MAGHPRVASSAERLRALQELARSERRDEADLARAIVLSVNGWTGGRIARAFGVTPDSVRRGRSRFAAEGVGGLLAGERAGRVGKLTRAALERRPWLRIERLPKYAPELSDVERSWRDLERHFLAHRTLRVVEDLDAAVATAVDRLNLERGRHLCHDRRIAA